MIRILHLMGAFNPGGIERWIIGILPYIDQNKYRLDFFCRMPEKGLLADQVEKTGSKIYVHSGNKMNFYSYSQELKQLVSNNNYDIIHNHLSIHCGIPALALKKFGIPTIVHFHNSTFAPISVGNKLKIRLSKIYAKFSLQKGIENSDLVLGCSKGVLVGIEKLYPLENVKKEAFYYGVKIPLLANLEKRNSFKRENDIPAKDLLIVHVGRFSPQKNHTFLVQVAKKLLDKYNQLTFVMVGDGTLRSNIQSLTEELKIDKKFKFLGIRKDVEDVLTCCDIFFFPSLWEGFGLAVMEASAAGIPVVGADVAGIQTAVKDNYSGFLCNLPHENEFIEKLSLLIDNEKVRATMGSHGRQRAIDEFSHAASADALEKLYTRFVIAQIQ